ncbi:MAG: LacI family transcriptional regulator [Candidatus Marinimicrobia bacterium]|nr:LacI family transcriptional regulator [Candidatus Neomarinimicrobiota bacterium]
MVTVRDVAREAGVSPTAVSLVLNDRPGVGAETKTRVRMAIQKTGYRPRAPGRPAQIARPLNLGIVYSCRVIHGGGLSKLANTWISAIRQTAKLEGHHISVFSGGADDEADSIFCHALDEGELDGVIAIGLASGTGYMKRLMRSGLPVVAMNRRAAHGEFSSVDMDNYGGGRAAAVHLLELGHERLAVLGVGDASAFFQERRQGFLDALAEANKDLVTDEETKVNVLPETLKKVLHRLRSAKVTGVFVLTDNIATQLLALMEEQPGKRLPQISIIGFDDTGAAGGDEKPPTSIGYDKALMGCEAALMLCDLVYRGEAIHCRTLMVPVQVVDHGTTAAPA